MSELSHNIFFHGGAGKPALLFGKGDQYGENSGIQDCLGLTLTWSIKESKHRVIIRGVKYDR